jgi:hypothetical protein
VITLELPYPSRDFVDEIVVMGHQQHSPRVALQRDVQRIDGFQV